MFYFIVDGRTKAEFFRKEQARERLVNVTYVYFLIRGAHIT